MQLVNIDYIPGKEIENEDNDIAGFCGSDRRCAD